jgi:peptidoglycan/LPS O-acetylase OafA/YrhL
VKFSLDRLRRTTNRKAFIPEIDGLRFFAIATVVFYHVNTAYAKSLGQNTEWGLSAMGSMWETGTLAWWWIRLDMGVKVFFSISGFVLALPFLKNLLQGGPEVNLKDYFIRRLTRLEPPFLVTLFLFLLVHVFMLGNPLSEMMPHFLAGIVYCHKLVFGTQNPINPVTWSLETEAQFYALVPFVFMLVAALRRTWVRWSLLLALSILSVLFRREAFYRYEEFLRLNMSILVYFINFATGILFAWCYLSYETFIRSKSRLWDLVGIASILVMFLVYKPQHFVSNNLLFNLCVFAMMTSVFKGPLLNRFFTLPFVYVTGGMCYTIYLIHFAFLFFIMGFTKGISTGLGYVPDLFLQTALVLPILFVVSAVFFLLIEKPCMDKNWPQRLTAYLRERFKPSVR